MSEKLNAAFAHMPLVAILRGVEPEEVVDIAESLYNTGIRIIEVPLNSPSALSSIERLNVAFGERCVCGAGTVLTVDEVTAVAQAGGELTVSPNCDAAVIGRSIELGMTPIPGWATATDAFAAYHAGARWLKLFPAATYGPGHAKAMSAVLPGDCKVLAVGGVGANVAGDWLRAGIAGFGIGTEIYSPGYRPDEVFDRASRVVAAIKAARNN